ncbi:MAG: dihydropteroate synthase [Clostridiales bacterium]|nr:dihydropteroate synthase [Clostridiales bacterium]
MIWKCKNKNIEYGGKTLIMAIVNITPDSFSDGGAFLNPESAVKRAVAAAAAGADIIDFGAYSTRPGHIKVSEREEWERLFPVLNTVKGKINIPISVDTFTPAVAKLALEAGADIINDVSGVVTTEMAQLVKKSGCGWVIMHNGAGGAAEVLKFFNSAIKQAQALGIQKNRLCLDMGIGFGKTRQQDFELIANIAEYKINGVPLLLGASRKRVIGEGSRQQDPQMRTYGNIAADAAAVLGGADIIRLHDVENEKHGIYMADALKKAAHT